jgi:hypothetical protein
MWEVSVKTRMVEERIGENLGPIDWGYDFTQHDWSCTHGGVNPECSKRATKLLEELQEARDAGQAMEAQFYSVMQPVVDVGMYDGWPFWRPVPSVCVQGPLGCEWHPWYGLMGIRSTPPRG